MYLSMLPGYNSISLFTLGISCPHSLLFEHVYRESVKKMMDLGMLPRYNFISFLHLVYCVLELVKPLAHETKIVLSVPYSPQS